MTHGYDLNGLQQYGQGSFRLVTPASRRWVSLTMSMRDFLSFESRADTGRRTSPRRVYLSCSTPWITHGAGFSATRMCNNTYPPREQVCWCGSAAFGATHVIYSSRR